MALHRGVLYYATSKVPSDKIEEEQGINYYEFKEYDIFKSFSKPNVIHSGKGIMATINDITPIGNKVRYTVYSVENNMFLGKEKSYDIKEKNITAIAEDINVTDMGPLTTDGENYIFTPIYISDEGIEYDDYIYTTNIVSGKSERLFKRACVSLQPGRGCEISAG